MTKLLLLFALIAVLVSSSAFADPAAPAKRVLIVTGDDYPGHVWRETAPVLKDLLARDPRLAVEVNEDPACLALPSLNDYDVVVLHFMNWQKPDPGPAARENLKQFVQGGKGLCLVHFACGAFQEWPGFKDIAGRVYDPKLRPHDPRAKFRVEIANAKHPITEGMEAFEADDELYTCLAGDSPIDVLATAKSVVDGKDYPMAFVFDCGKGRVFHCLLGHDVAAFAPPGVAELFRRGCAWTAGLVPARQSQFEKLCVPVVKAGLMGTLVGPGPGENDERVYFNFRQDGGKLFLVAVDPATDKAEQFQSPAGSGAWGFIVGSDKRIYLGTHEGPDANDSGQILVFDPKHPEKQIEIVGRPSPTETYLWMYTNGHDGKLYGCTYPLAKLVSYDPKTGAMADLGVMDETQKYTRSICTGPDGRIYIGVGFGRANVVVYDPKTGEHKVILPDEYRKDPAQTVASVYTGVDGNVYVSAIKMKTVEGAAAQAGSVCLVLKGDVLEETTANATEMSKARFSDGRVVANAKLDGTYEIVKPDASVEKHRFEYKGAGSGIFMTATGPLGRIYGSTAMPCEMFWYDPAKSVSENPGNPCEVGGEIYSMLDHHGVLYICAYPGSFLSKWDPAKPWNYGRGAENNPRGFGPLGVGHLRPRAMIHGPEEKIYIGSYPEYGRHGGSMGVWDPAQDKLIENYHHLIKNQSIVTLVYDAKTGLVFGGSCTSGGGGTNPVEPEAKFFAFDATKKALVMEEAPVSGAQAIQAMTLVGRNIFAAAGKTLFVYDIDAKQYLHKGELPGGMRDCSLEPWKDGNLYGLTGSHVLKIDPKTFRTDVIATYESHIHCGFAMDDKGIYFGDRATLMRFNWPAK